MRAASTERSISSVTGWLAQDRQPQGIAKTPKLSTPFKVSTNAPRDRWVKKSSTKKQVPLLAYHPRLCSSTDAWV